MPSTYSPDLRIELIANGEQSGSWGNTTNTNLGTLIEDAISGLATVSVTSADQALTAFNGASDQARCAAISLTTLTGANFAVYVPPVTKLYAIKNASAYTATIYCSTVLGNTTAAGAGVAIPAGKAVLVRTDGTDVVEQLNYVAGSLNIGGNFSVTGDATFTTQSPGDSTTKAATTAFVTNAVNTATGSLGTMSTQNANNVNITGGTMSGMTSIADTVGNVRNLPINDKTSSYALAASDNGRVVSITTGGVTVPSGVFSVGQSVSVYNNSGSVQTITQGSGATLRQVITGATGNRSLTGYGLCTILCVASDSFVITGAGVS